MSWLQRVSQVKSDSQRQCCSGDVGVSWPPWQLGEISQLRGVRRVLDAQWSYWTRCPHETATRIEYAEHQAVR